MSGSRWVTKPFCFSGYWNIFLYRSSVKKGMANHFSILDLKPHEHYEKQKYMTLKEEPAMSVGVQYIIGEEWRKSSRLNEEAEPKWKRYPTVYVSVGESQVHCCKEQCCIGCQLDQVDWWCHWGQLYPVLFTACLINQSLKEMNWRRGLWYCFPSSSWCQLSCCSHSPHCLLNPG